MEPTQGDIPTNPDYGEWLARKRAWWAWHNDNPEVWRYFERFAKEAMEHGHVRISHWLIMNRIRWEVMIVTTGVQRGDEVLKLSNDHFAWYARFWKACYPEHAGLFKTKLMIGEPHDSPLVG